MENWLDKYDDGSLIKRADGSYSQRGLWDNIRANRGSGHKPTAEMLRQERKIKKKEDGSIVEGEDPPATFGNPFANYMQDWTNSPMGQSMLQKSVQKDNPSAARYKFWDDTIAENTMRNIRGERLNPNYSKTSFTKPYWQQMRDARISAIDNVDYQSLSNQDFNNYLNLTGDYNLAPNEISNVSGQSSFSLTRKPFGDFINNPTVDKFREITRPENVDDTNYLNFVGNPYRTLTEYTPSSKFRPMIRLRNNVSNDNFADTSVHEISHTSDWNGTLMPESDKNLIRLYGEDAADTKFNNYVKEATETRARLNSLRYQMKNQGIYDPFTEKATIDMFDSYKPLDDSSYDALEQLRGVYSDDEILNMINTISRKEPAKNPMLDNIQYAKDGGWIDMYADGDVVTGENPPSRLQELAAQYQAIQEQVNKGDIGKKAYLDKMRSVADDLIAKGFALEDSGIIPKSVYEHSTSTGSCIGTACYIADQAGDKFYPQGSSFFTSNSNAQDYARDNPNASRYLEQNEKYISPTDIIQFKSGEKGVPYHAYTVYDIGQPNEEGDRIITVVGSPGHGPVHKKTYILGKDNKIYSDQYGSKGSMLDTQLLKRREDNTEYNNLLSQRDALKQQILEVDPTYFTPKEDIRSGDYQQTAFMLNDQGQGNEYGRYVQTENGVKIQTPNPGVVDQAYNAKSYIDASKSGLTEILAKYNDPQYKYDYMRKHNISNAEYDALVSNMVGIYGAETKYGTDYVGKKKELMGVKVPAPEWPWATKIADKLGIINQEEKSIGPFQLTYNQLPEEYRKTIKGDDLYDPIIAADATMEYLTAGLPLLRKRANTTAETATERNPYSQNITKDNYLEYVPYLYNMRGWLKGDKSTMENKGDILRGDAGYKQLVDQYRNNVLQIIPLSLFEPNTPTITQQRNGGYIQKPCCNSMYNDGSWVTNSSIPTPTTPSFYDAGADRTLTNYQMGTPKARMYGPGGEIDLHLDKKSRKDSPRITPQGFLVQDPMGLFIGGAGLNYKANDNLNISPYVIGVGNEYFQKFPVDYGVGLNYSMGRFNPSVRLGKNPGIGMSYKFNNGGPVMYNAGSTVFTKQNSALWVNGGKEIGTQDKRYPSRNTGSLDPDHYTIGDNTLLPKSLHAFDPSAGTHDYNQDVQPYHTMRLHAPDTTMMARHGSFVKKHINSPRVYGSPVNPSGMFQGPTSQRGVMFRNGSIVGNGETLPIDPRTGLPVKTLKEIEVVADRPLTLEQKIDKRLGYPMKKAFDAAEAFSIDRYNKKLDQVNTDNYRHPMGAKYTSEAIQREFPSFLKGTGIPEVAGFVGANALGLGHEIKAFNSDRPLWESIRSTGEDLYNNGFGSIIGSLSFLPEAQKTKILQDATINGYIPDGEHYGEFNINNYRNTNSLQQKKRRDGGWIDKYDAGSTIGGEDNIVGTRGPNDNIKVQADPATGMPIVNLKGVEIMPYNKWQSEFEEKQSREDFIKEQKQKYLKDGYSGLQKGLGVDFDNFPKDVEDLYGNQYDYLRNNYAMEQYAKENNIDLSSRADWVETLSPEYKKIITNSKYGTMLQPSAWDRGLSGLQQIGNTLLPGKPFNNRIQGLTTTELQEANDSWLSGADIFSPINIIGRNTANYLSNRGVSTGSDFKQLPGFFSGQNMPNVSEGTVMAFDPTTYSALATLPETVSGLYSGLNFLNNEANLLRTSGLKNYSLDKGIQFAANAYNKSKVGPIKLGPIGKEYASGFYHGLTDVKGGRPFFETFPMTGKQVNKVKRLQNAAANTATEFVKDWYYPDRSTNPNPTLDKTAYDAVQKVINKAGYSFSPIWNSNVILGAHPILADVRKNKVAKDVATSLHVDVNEPIVKYFVDEITKMRSTAGGFMLPTAPNMPVTFRNQGFYFIKPSTIQHINAHELGHTATAADNSWNFIANFNPSAYKYLTANTNNPVGMEFKNAMVEPNNEYKLFREDLDAKGIFSLSEDIKNAPSHLQQTLNNLYDKSYLWQAYPGEMHSNLMSARLQGYQDLMSNYGYSHSDAIKALKKPEDMTVDYLIGKGNLNQFFKPTTSQAVKRKLIRGFHKDGGYIQNNNSNAWLEQYN